MGFFSWMFADTANKERLIIGEVAYVATPDGTFIYEPCYDGYGNFGGKDIYELVADWNREFISSANIEKPERSNYTDCYGHTGEEYYNRACRAYETDCLMIKEFVAGRTKSFMNKKYGNDWKQEIGIMIACSDEDNAKLKYPIKICRKADVVYDAIPPSTSDPMQGCY